ncbi:MAG: hypothetical protein Q9170_006890 [Blastenia crenularia]
MAPGGDWLAKKLLGKEFVADMDRRNAAAEKSWLAPGKQPQTDQYTSSTPSYYTNSPKQVAMRGGNAPQNHGGSPASAQYAENRSNHSHSSRRQARGGDEDARVSQRLLVDPYGVTQGAADAHRTVDDERRQYAPPGSHRPQSVRQATVAPGVGGQDFYPGQQYAAHPTAGSYHQQGTRQSHAPSANAPQGADDYYKGHRTVEITPRSSHHSAHPSPMSRQPSVVNRSGNGPLQMSRAKR